MRTAFLLAAVLCLAPLAAGAAEKPIGVVLGPPAAVVNPSPEFIPTPIAPPLSATGVAPPAPLPPLVVHVAPVLVVPRVPVPLPTPARR